MINILIWGFLGAFAYLLLVGGSELKDRINIKRRKLNKKEQEPILLKPFLGSVLASFLVGIICGLLGYLNVLGPGAIVSREFRQSQRLTNSFVATFIFSPFIPIFVYDSLARKYKSRKKTRKK